MFLRSYVLNKHLKHLERRLGEKKVTQFFNYPFKWHKPSANAGLVRMALPLDRMTSACWLLLSVTADWVLVKWGLGIVSEKEKERAGGEKCGLLPSCARKSLFLCVTVHTLNFIWAHVRLFLTSSITYSQTLDKQLMKSLFAS